MVKQHIGRGTTMVKIGFICDGETELVIFKSEMFKKFLRDYNFELAGVVKYTGGKIKRDTDRLINRNNAKKVVIIKDLEQLPSEEDLRKQLNAHENISDKNVIVIVKKMIEAWFLADTNTMKKITGNNWSKFNSPENEINPFRTLKNKLGGAYRNISKPAMANLFIRKGFTITSAAKHPQCHSVRHFIEIIKKL